MGYRGMTVGATPLLPYHMEAPSFTLERSAAGGGETSSRSTHHSPNSSVYSTSHAISFDQYKIWVISRQGAGGPPRGSASGEDDPAPGRRPDGMPHIASERCIVPQPIEPVGAAPG